MQFLMVELIRVPAVNKQQIAHLGSEHDKSSRKNAELILRAGHIVTMIGEGPSMEPLISSGTRMVIGPWAKGRRPKKYEILFCRAGNGGRFHTLHLCWYVMRRKFLMIDTKGRVLGYIPFKYILGEYLGAWDTEKRDIIPYVPNGVTN